MTAPDPSPGPDETLADAVDRLHGLLRATEERPVERAAGRWVGEAQAVAADAADAAATGVDDAVVRERVAAVGDLLANVEGTGDERADDRVEAAARLAARIAEE